VRQFRPVPLVTMYDGEIRQVIANLVGNALDAMSSGPAGPMGVGRLLLRLRSVRDSRTRQREVTILIADTGSGMSAATLQRIYEPFFSTKGVTGTGLGLWVSREIVARHHGKVRVRTSQRQPSGTVFRLVLPVEEVPEASRSDGDGLPSFEG
jgi:signal transduction histidine kinase